MTQFKTFPLMLLIGLISLCSCDSCSDEINTTVLPPETQSGENTLGCYVNDELFVHNGTAPFMHKSINAEFIRQNNKLIIKSYASNDRDIYIEDSIILLNQKKKISMAYYMSSEIPRSCFCFAGKNFGEIILTKFDTINKIVSGRFQFNGRCSDDQLRPTGDSIVNITQGRFDIRLEIYDN